MRLILGDARIRSTRINGKQGSLGTLMIMGSGDRCCLTEHLIRERI